MLQATVTGHIGSLQIDAGLVAHDGPLVLVGPNGAGKTTLLLMLLGARRPEAGRITLGETVLLDSTSGVDVPIEERRLGYVPQDYALFPHLTVLENVEFARSNEGQPRRARARQLVDEFGLAPLANRRTTELSGGEKQKVALARALAAEPRALLLDEPLAALDAATRRDVRSFLCDYLAKLDLPTVLVTHDPADALAFGARIGVMEGGRVIQSGTWEELRAHPASPFVEQFVSSGAR